jgi:ABC-type bacteriocin/lantibiotic exporter with double-glycine peptidase domain
MSETETAPIPYEKQEDLHTNRMCGAACLSMVYRSFGRRIPQAEIWSRISKHNRFGSLASTTHLMAQDAITRGYSALVIQAKQPLQVLRLCRENGIRALLNHRLKDDSPTGHYSVLVDIDADSVVLHDPFVGPLRRLSHAELLRLWQKGPPDAEISGNILIGVAARHARFARRRCPRRCAVRIAASPSR